MNATVQATADRLVGVVEEAARLLRLLGDAHTAARPAPGKWCAKEVLGHLIDSACNNHQRVVRAQLAGELVFPGYEQDGWVAAQGYAAAPWADLLELWRLYNMRLAALMRGIPAHRLASSCRIGSREPVTLEWLVKDYLRHVEHHLGQLGVAGGRK